MHPDTITRGFSRRVDRAGGTAHHGWTASPHTYATLARDFGVSGKIVTDRLGHANQTVTQQIYANPTGATAPLRR